MPGDAGLQPYSTPAPEAPCRLPIKLLFETEGVVHPAPVNVLEILEQEAAFEPGTRALVRSVNRRLTTQPIEGEFWIRMRPPTLGELKSGQERPTLIKFYRVASLVQVAKVLVDFVEVTCAGSTMLFVLEEFLDTWVKVNYWPGRQSSQPPQP